MCLTLKGYLSDKRLFDAIQAVKAFPFLEGNLSAVMESSFKLLYGQRVMFSAIEDLTIEEVAQQLVMLHGERWLQMTTAASELNIAGDYTVKKKGSKAKDSNKTGSNKTEHQTVAYNEVDLSTESADVNTSTETDVGTETSLGDEEKISYSSYFKNLQNSDQLDIMNLVLRDCAKLLTITIY